MTTPDPKRPRPPASPATRRPAALDRTQIDGADGGAAGPGEHRNATTGPPIAPTASGRWAVAGGRRVELEPGLRIEQYELIRELGRGGMGQVFLARDTRLGRRVAMKFLAAPSPRVAQRFLIEARTTAQCSHENIVVIHDVDQYEGLPYMVLEYVEGVSLGTLFADKPLPAGRATELIVPVVRALARAHEANIVHRDLKPDNIVVTAAGTVKVLDFGIAKLFAAPERPTSDRAPSPGLPIQATRAGAVVGTLPYMSPEQLGMDDVDHRSDLWAVGIILFEMLSGRHPLDPVTEGRLFGAAAMIDEPLPSIGDRVPGLPDRLVAIVDRCLAKKKLERYATAAELVADLEPLLPGRRAKLLEEHASPYPGLTAFQEWDADRFFGRSQDVALLVARLRDHPLVGVVGPSGVGKSSFVRAGLVPALKRSGDPWEVIIVRPGRHPLAALASTIESLRESRDSDPVIGAGDLALKLLTEPGTLGARLRARARRKRSQILLFIDQHEELYTLVADPEERAAFTACLVGAADDPSGPLRVVVSMRSDFLDRAAEDRPFVDELSRGLVFLQAPSRGGLEEALTQPLDMVGYTFEAGIVDDMLHALDATPGSLPLLQFTSAKLWDARERKRRVLTREAYFAMGGVAGALAAHADELYAGLTPSDQGAVRALLLRLVTPERTRAIVDTRELRALAPDIDRIVALLVEARLLVVQARGEDEGPAVELVHESLIQRWPSLRKWLDDSTEDSAFLAQLRAAAKQWDSKGRPDGLLWRAEAMHEARLWRSRYQGQLPAREHAYLEAVIALGTRDARRKRSFVVAGFALLGALVVAAGLALVVIREKREDALREKGVAVRETVAADQARKAADEARKTAEHARVEAEAAREEQAKTSRQLADKVDAYEVLLGEKRVAEVDKRTAEDKAQLAAAEKRKAQQDARAVKARAEKARLDKLRKIGTGDLK